MSTQLIIIEKIGFTTEGLQVGIGIPQRLSLSLFFLYSDMIENYDVNLDINRFINGITLLATGNTTKKNSLLLKKTHKISHT